MKQAIVVSGRYLGRIGKATEPNQYGNVMFYPIEGIYPYRVCLKAEQIHFIKGGDVNE